MDEVIFTEQENFFGLFICLCVFAFRPVESRHILPVSLQLRQVGAGRWLLQPCQSWSPRLGQNLLALLHTAQDQLPEDDRVIRVGVKLQVHLFSTKWWRINVLLTITPQQFDDFLLWPSSFWKHPRYRSCPSLWPQPGTVGSCQNRNRQSCPNCRGCWETGRGLLRESLTAERSAYALPLRTDSWENVARVQT